MPKVSICVPTYNQTKILKKTIDSILSQTYSDYEIVITDDSNSNIVSDFISGFQHCDKIKYFKNNFPLGSPENWNEAIKKSKGEYIKILHHDDWFTFDESLSEFVQILDNNPLIDFAYSSSHALFETGEMLTNSVTEKQLDYVKTNPLSLFSGNTIGAPSAVIFRKKNNMLFDCNLKWLVDIDYYIRYINTNNNIGANVKPLVTTFAANDRITNSCFNNKQIEIYEYFYLLEKVSTITSGVISKKLKNCIATTIKICNRHMVTDVYEVRNCGFKGKIPKDVKVYFFLNKISDYASQKYLDFLES